MHTEEYDKDLLEETDNGGKELYQHATLNANPD